jgi:hypothetical protein
MRLEALDFLRLAERAHSLAFVDIEGSGLRGDYNSTLVVSIKPHGLAPYSQFVTVPGDDRKLVRWAKRELEKYDCWVTYYGKGYDIPMLNTRLLKHWSKPIEPRHHIDMYYTLKFNLLTARRSQAHLLRFLETPTQKMDMDPDEWNQVLANPKRHMPRMIARCESDVRGLAGLYERTKHLIRDIKRGGI